MEFKIQQMTIVLEKSQGGSNVKERPLQSLITPTEIVTANSHVTLEDYTFGHIHANYQIVFVWIVACSKLRVVI